MSAETLARIAAAMGCAAADDDDLVEAVRLLVSERDAAQALAGRRGRLIDDTMTSDDAMQAYARALIDAPPHGPNCVERGGKINGRGFLLTIQWHGGKTSLEMRAEALAERDAAVAQRDALAAAVREYIAALDAPCVTGGTFAASSAASTALDATLAAAGGAR